MRYQQGKEANPFELMSGDQPVSERHPAMCVVKAVRNLYGEGKFGSGDRHACIHIEIDIKSSGQDYQPGDHIGIYPANQDKVVNRLLEKIDANGSKVISLKPGKRAPEGLQPPFDVSIPLCRTCRCALVDMYIKSESRRLYILVNLVNRDKIALQAQVPLPLYDVLKYLYDITGPLRRSQLASLAQCAKDPSEREQLSLMASTKGNDIFQQRIATPKATLLDVLDLFPSARPSVSHLLSSLAHRLQPRSGVPLRE